MTHSYVPDIREPAARTGLITRLEGWRRRYARLQLEAYLVPLHHTDEISIVGAMRIVRLLSAPEQLSKAETCRRLCDILAIQRSRQNWGRVWTFEQIYRVATKMRESRPVWNEDVSQWSPKKIARMGRLDMTAVTAMMKLAKMRRGK